MTSKAEAIARAMVAALTVPPMSSVRPDRVHRDLIGALQPTQTPAIAVEVGSEEAPAQPVIGHTMRAVYIDVHALQAGPDAASAVDAVALEAYDRIMQSADLKALTFDVEEGAVSRENDVAGTRIALVTRTWRVRYRTLAGSIQ